MIVNTGSIFIQSTLLALNIPYGRCLDPQQHGDTAVLCAASNRGTILAVVSRSETAQATES